VPQPTSLAPADNTLTMVGKTLLLVSLLGLALGDSFDYCTLGSTHQLCGTQGLGAKCIGTKDEGLYQTVTADDKAEILRVHNALRAKVAKGEQGSQPAASNMRYMVWDDELAATAQALANTCVYGHDKYAQRATKDGRFEVGQNIAARWSYPKAPAKSWETPINSWFSEVKDMTSSIVSSFKSPTGVVIGHYTQIVWAKTYSVGCGFTQFKDGTWYQNLYVCNYGPAGNWGGEPVYEQGTACSACPAGTSCVDGALCK